MISIVMPEYHYSDRRYAEYPYAEWCQTSQFTNVSQILRM
jgi:hypothetical protein